MGDSPSQVIQQFNSLRNMLLTRVYRHTSTILMSIHLRWLEYDLVSKINEKINRLDMELIARRR